MITIRVNSAECQARLARLIARARRPRTLLQAATRAARTVLTNHFRERDQAPNRLGGRRTHFWLDVLRSTQIGEVTDHRGTIVIGDARPGRDTPGRGGLTDLGSVARTELIYQQQVGQAYGFAGWKAGQDADALAAAPAQELVRIRASKVPRDWPGAGCRPAASCTRAGAIIRKVE